MLPLIVGALGSLLALGLAGAAGASRPIAGPIHLAAAVVSAGLALLAITRLVLPADAPETLILPIGLPWLGFHLRLDDVSALFLVIVNLPAAMIGLFAVGYARHGDPAPRIAALHPVFVAAMNAVLVADDAYGFLFAWELMSLSSWALVLADHRATEAASAAWLYLVIATVGTLCLMFAFGVLAVSAGQYDFTAMRATRLSSHAAA